MSLSETRKAIRELPDKDGVISNAFTCADLKELEAALTRLEEAIKQDIVITENVKGRDFVDVAFCMSKSILGSREDPPTAEARATPSGQELSESGS